MKKWMISLAAIFAVILTGCSDNNSSAVEGKADASSPAAAADEEKPVTLLINLQMEMIQIIREHLGPVTAYERSEGAGDREAAVEASNRIANELRGIEVPEELNGELQADMKESIELLALYFEERAAALGTDADMEEMNAAFEKFHEKIGETFESAGVHAPNFEKDVY
jgi:ABC-type enterochelin transport system substrate-binding protein